MIAVTQADQGNAGATRRQAPRGPSKCPTGIRGLDEILTGGVPRGRPTLVCGGAGCGKTLLAMEFLVHGAVEHGEAGVFIAFEESVEELRRNVASLGHDLRTLAKQHLLLVEHVELSQPQEESGDFTLEGLFVRLQHAVAQVNAKRVVLDTIENLFAGFTDERIVRTEMQRLFHWIKANHLTAIVTAERGDGSLTRQGIEEYVSDCVILLDNRINEQLATRRLRVVKYRGSAHGGDEYPFLIDKRGIVIVPATSVHLNQQAPTKYVSSGIRELDLMLGGKGYYAGSTVLVSGGAGTGKSCLAACFLDGVCRRGERAMYFSFEESKHQIVRGMNSIGLDLQKRADKGLLRFHCSRPSLHGLELHLVSMHAVIEEFRPAAVVIDPFTDLSSIGSSREVHAMLTRLIDFLKAHNLTTILTGLTYGDRSLEEAAVGISSLIDTWIELRDVETSAERNRTIYVRKSRGMAHSNQVREFLITSRGILIMDVCVGEDGILMGSARRAHILRLRGLESAQQRRSVALRKQLESRKAVMEARIATLRTEMKAELERLESDYRLDLRDELSERRDRSAMGELRTECGVETGLPGRRART